jgi:superfamily II DNA/RNA helicase
MSFASLGLAPSLVHAAQRHGLLAPTAIQTQALPAILDGQDLRACAPTGSGKTAAYVLPLLQRWMLADAPTGPRSTQTLVLVPTRELASQVAELVYHLGEAMGQRPKVAVLTGGVSINPQLMALRGGVDWVIATPGRLLDVVEHSRLQLNRIHTLVLDEADRLMDLGFAEELDRVLALLPATGQRQTLLLSATFPPAVEAIAAPAAGRGRPRGNCLHPPAGRHHRAAGPACGRGQPHPLLRDLLQEQRPRALVFVASRYSAEHVAFKLKAHGIAARAFHGELSQGARQAALADFKSGLLQVLVTTDLAARGIHVDALPVVINYDLPRSPTDYTHRIGRTGRAGLSGLAISLVSPATAAHWQLIAKRNALEVALEDLPAYPVTELPPARARTRTATTAASKASA